MIAGDFGYPQLGEAAQAGQRIFFLRTRPRKRIRDMPAIRTDGGGRNGLQSRHVFRSELRSCALDCSKYKDER
jgi:hypothetical protein